MPTISAYILAYNEAEKIEAAAASVLWADEIVMIDSDSTDGTAEIAAALGARVVQIPFLGFGELRNRGLSQCGGDCIFSLDPTRAAQRRSATRFLRRRDPRPKMTPTWCPAATS